MAHQKNEQTKPVNSWKIVSTVLIVALIATSFIVLYQGSHLSTVYAEYTCLGVSVTPNLGTEPIKLGVNESYTLSAHLDNGTAPFTYMWRVAPSGNLTITVNNETWILNETKVFTSETVTLRYPQATEEYVTVDLTVKDSHLLSGNLLHPIIVADPYTASTQYISSANAASYTYKIETDGLDWYRAISGLDGSISWTSTNKTYVQEKCNTALATDGGVIQTNEVSWDFSIKPLAANVTLIESYQGHITTYNTVQVKQNVVAGNVLFLNNTGYFKADSTTSATMPAILLATQTASANDYCFVLSEGFFTNPDWNWANIGQPIYVSTTGSLTQTAPSASGNQIQVLGYATGASTIYFDPNLLMIEHA